MIDPEIMARGEFGSLELILFGCQEIENAGAGALRVIEILQEAGGQFLRVQVGNREGPPAWEVHPNPTEIISQDGSFSFPDFAHPLLRRSRLQAVQADRFPPSCLLSYRPDSRTVSFSQSASPGKPKNLDALARGQFALARLLYPLLRPQLAFIDEVSETLDDEKVLFRPLLKYLRQDECPYLFWANFFSPPLVAKVGHYTLAAAPGRITKELDDGGFVYVATTSFCRWWRRPPNKIRKYFRAELPRLILYNTERLIAGADPIP